MVHTKGKNDRVEVWKDIRGYENLYQGSNLGRARSLDRWVKSKSGSVRLCKGRILKPFTTKNGYLHVVLSKNNKIKTYYVHRLVAEVFLPNPNNYKEVNHKDEDKTNNSVDNLEWCSAKYNSNYGTRNERMSKKCSKPVLQYDLEGNLIREWKSTRECDRNGYIEQAISACCQGKRKTHKGFIWKYK